MSSTAHSIALTHFLVPGSLAMFVVMSLLYACQDCFDREHVSHNLEVFHQCPTIRPPTRAPTVMHALHCALDLQYCTCLFPCTACCKCRAETHSLYAAIATPLECALMPAPQSLTISRTQQPHNGASGFRHAPSCVCCR